MRLIIINLLAAALLSVSAGTASAILFTLGGADGQEVAAGDQVSVTVTMDTQETVGITVMSAGVLFDDTRLTYNPGASSTVSYVLYGGKGGGGYLKAAQTCGGYPGATAGAGCDLALDGQVNVDYVSVDLTNGTQNSGVVMLVTLVFDVIDPQNDGSAFIELTSTSPGNVVGQPGGGSVDPSLDSGTGNVVVPEPAIAGLALAALITVGGLRSRERRRL